MTNSRYVTPGRTIARIERLRTLVTALLAGDMNRDEIGELLEIGPSGVRKYLADLCQMVKVIGLPGEQIVHLVASDAETRTYLATLKVDLLARSKKPSKSAKSVAELDPRRHIHVMEDDVQYHVRLHRGPVARDPMVAALFGPGVPVAMLPTAFFGQRAAEVS